LNVDGQQLAAADVKGSIPMPNLVNFTFTTENLFNGAAAKACRLAVLWPIAASRAEKERVSTTEAYRLLYECWRHRLRELEDVGWRADATAAVHVEDPAHRVFSYLANCPPFGIHVPEAAHLRTCCRARVCPMCYMRRVVHPAFAAIEHALFEGRREPVRPNVGLVAVQRMLKTAATTRNSMAEWLQFLGRDRDVFSLIKPKRCVLGKITVLTMAPPGYVADGDGVSNVPLIWLRLSAIAAVTNKARLMRLREAYGPQATGVGGANTNLLIRGYREIAPGAVTRDSVAKLVGWACRYPLGMLFGDPQQTVDILDAAAAMKARMLRTTGILRNRKDREGIATG
jgi:hypothetical protein